MFQRLRSWLTIRNRSISLADEALALVDDTAAALAPLDQQTTGDDGKPRRRFRKDLIRAGEFTHPVTGQRVKVDDKRLDHWVQQFQQMQANGVKVPVPAGHTDDAEKNRGYLQKLERQGDRLVGEIELIGEDAIASAGRSEISVQVVPKFKDGEGNEYQDAIRHAALVSTPVINRQSGWVAASADAASDDRLALYIHADPQGADAMKKLIDLINKTLGLNLSADADTDKLVGELKPRLEALAQAQGGDTTKLQQQITEKDRRIAELEGKLEQAPEPVSLSANERFYGQRMLASELDALVSQGHITPACRKQIEPMLQTDVMLAATAGGQPPAIAWVEALKTNDPVELSEKTDGQAVELGGRPDGDTPTKDPDLAERQKAIALAHGIPTETANK